MLHAPLDTDMMRYLCRNSPSNLQGVNRTEYQRLQALVNDAIKDAGIYPVQYDDLMWRYIQRHVPKGLFQKGVSLATLRKPA